MLALLPTAGQVRDTLAKWLLRRQVAAQNVLASTAWWARYEAVNAVRVNPGVDDTLTGWLDSSGNGRHLGDYVHGSPQYIADAVNGYPAVDFVAASVEAIGYNLSTAELIAQQTWPGLTVFAVIKCDGTADYAPWSFLNNNDRTENISGQFNGTSNCIGHVSQHGATYTYTTQTTLATPTAAYKVCGWRFDNATEQVTGFLSGTSEGPDAHSTWLWFNDFGVVTAG
ncbi:MAG: hypothetical protein KDA63_05220, partial [Planctomycetales bacterium]|nr:hypothetical protein [Planctomycetales bacterium]